MRFLRAVALVATLVLSASASAFTTIGTLTAEGRYEIVAAGDDRATSFDQDEYTFFSGDTVNANSGAVVLNLDGGGGLGLTQGSRMAVATTDAGAVVATLISGSMLYAFPRGSRDFQLRAGNFVASGNPEGVRAIQVADATGSVGTLELLQDGNLKTWVREGSLYIRNGEAIRYKVDAGESAGLLDVPGRSILTQSGPGAGGGAVPLILLQSPEQVGTREAFSVRWQAFDPIEGDFIVIAEEGAAPDEFESVVSSDEGSVVEFEAPGTPGDYEIRFIDGETGEIKRFVYLDVVDEIIGGYWANRVAAGALGVVTGGATVFISSQIGANNDPEPASP